MKREIKFRGKIKNDYANNWIYGDLLRNFYIQDGIKIDCGIVEDLDVAEVIPETVSQFTGLKDKNYNELYGKDICKVFNAKMNEHEIGLIVMSGLGCWSLKIGNIKVPIFEFIDNTLSIVHDFSRIERIGNIYENPKLLNQNNQTA